MTLRAKKELIEIVFLFLLFGFLMNSVVNLHPFYVSVIILLFLSFLVQFQILRKIKKVLEEKDKK